MKILKILKLFLSILAIIFAVLGITNVLPYAITNPVMVMFLSGTYFVNAIEYYNFGDLRKAKYYTLLAVFMLFIIYYVQMSVPEAV